MEYKIIMNNGDLYYYKIDQKPMDFLESIKSHEFIETYKYDTEYGGARMLTVFLSTKNISEIIPWEE